MAGGNTQADISVTLSPAPWGDELPVEIVERKGLGHPDTVCDILAERVSQALSRHYRERFGMVLHHNVDKVLLRGGAAEPCFGGGRVIEPIEIYVAGRATSDVEGSKIPVDDIVVETCRAALRDLFRHLDADAHVRIFSLVRPGSADLVDLFRRQESTGVRLANDTSIGVGYAPLSALERAVIAVEGRLNAADFKATNPEAGEDVKVMAVRRPGGVSLTVACALVDRHVSDIARYRDCKARIAEAARRAASGLPGELSVDVNAADDLERGSAYLTVTGTSAEAGDDGQVGRGNRVNGLITPGRPMTIEAAAGKNPLTHVGKIYNVAAGLLAGALVAEIPEIAAAECYLVSRIGQPVREPQLVDIRLRTVDGRLGVATHRRVASLVAAQLAGIDDLSDRLIAGEFSLV